MITQSEDARKRKDFYVSKCDNMPMEIFRVGQ